LSRRRAATLQTLRSTPPRLRTHRSSGACHGPSLSVAVSRRRRTGLGLGPLWAVYDADRLADFKDKPIKQRFALCPWGLYFIEVKAA